MTEEEVQAIEGLRGQVERLTAAVTDLRVSIAGDVATLQADSHKRGDCPAIVQVQQKVNKLWDGRNTFLGVAAGIGVGSGLGAAGVLKLLGTL